MKKQLKTILLTALTILILGGAGFYIYKLVIFYKQAVSTFQYQQQEIYSLQNFITNTHPKEVEQYNE